METPGFLLMFMLGLRHGFDPDHIAIIDGMGLQVAGSRPSVAGWTGTLFAIGHGLVITTVAVTISLFSHSFELPDFFWAIMDWIPALLLIAVGILNAATLLRTDVYKPKSFRSALLPARLRRSTHPLAIVLIGVLFALVFDTTTQVAAWAYTASSRITTTEAFLLGLSFSSGMVLTDSIDSGMLYHLVKRTSNKDLVSSYRRKLGWIIVFISMGTGLYKIMCLVMPGAEIPDNYLTAIGVGFFTFMAAFYILLLFSWKKIKRIKHGD